MLGGTSKWDVIGSRPAGDQSNLKSFVRSLGRENIPVIFLEPMGKEPIDLRSLQMRNIDDATAQQAAKAAGNPRWAEVRTRAGIQIATSDVKRLEKYADRAAKLYGDAAPNLAIVPTDGLLIVDTDHSEGVESFRAAFRAATGEDISPTVLTPGQQNDDGSWKHQGGGHFYLKLPDGYELPDSVRSFSMGEGKYMWSIFPLDHYVLIPPSIRKEGMYRWVGTVHDAPPPLIALIEDDAKTRAEAIARKAERAAARSGPTGIDAWAAATDWASLLEPDGWFVTGCRTTCGCPEVTAPGVHASPKSATAHEPGCLETDTSSGHGPLHVWTDNPPPGIAAYVKATGSKTLTKLQYVAWTKFGGNESTAIKSLGIIGGTIIGATPEQLRATLRAKADEEAKRKGAAGNPLPRPPILDPMGDDKGTPPSPPQSPPNGGEAEDNLDDMPEGYTGVTPRDQLDVPTRDLQDMLRPFNRSFDPYDTAVYPSGFHSHYELLREIFDFSDTTRAIFHKARKRRPRPVHPVALLLNEMIRRGTRCPVSCRLWPGTPTSTYVVVAGRSGLGKSESAKPDASPWQKLKAPSFLEQAAARRVTLSADDHAKMQAQQAAGSSTQIMQPIPVSPNGQSPNGSGKGGTNTNGSPATSTGAIAKPSFPVLLPHNFDETTSLGSGQVLSDHLITILGKGEDTMVQMIPHSEVWVFEDEMTVMLKAAKGETSTIISTLNAAWAGMPIGNRTRMHGDRRTNGPYNVFITAGLQPKLCGQLFCHDDSGFLQRFVFSATSDPYRFVNEPVLPEPTVTPSGELPLIGPTDRFTADPKVIDAVEYTGFDYDLDHLGDDYAEMMSHAPQVRIRMACLGALLHGSLHVTWGMWEWTGKLMEHSHRVFTWLEQQGREQEQIAAAKAGGLAAVQRAAQIGANSDGVGATCEKILSLLTRSENGLTQRDIYNKLAKTKQAFAVSAINHLQVNNMVYLDGIHYRLVQPAAKES